MRDRVAIAVKDWHAWSPAFATKSQWRQWACPGDSDPADCHELASDAAPAALPMALRRRATPLGQRILSSAIAAGGHAKEPRYILACRHGEFSRFLGIVTAIVKEIGRAHV